MHFEVVGEITDIETIAVGNAIRDVARLQESYGVGRWRKPKRRRNRATGEWQHSSG